MSFAAQILAEAQAAFAGIDGACLVRDGHDEFAALCTGIEEIYSPTDQGLVKGYSGNVRYALTAEQDVIKAGGTIKIKRTGIDAKFLTARVSSRHSIGGAVRLTIVAEFE